MSLKSRFLCCSMGWECNYKFWWTLFNISLISLSHPQNACARRFSHLHISSLAYRRTHSRATQLTRKFPANVAARPPSAAPKRHSQEGSSHTSDRWILFPPASPLSLSGNATPNLVLKQPGNTAIRPAARFALSRASGCSAGCSHTSLPCSVIYWISLTLSNSPAKSFILALITSCLNYCSSFLPGI